MKKDMMLVLACVLLVACAISASAAITISGATPANNTVNNASSVKFSWKCTSENDPVVQSGWSFSLTPSGPLSGALPNTTAANASTFNNTMGFTAANDGYIYWSLFCNSSTDGVTQTGYYRLLSDLTGPYFTNATLTVNVPATDSTPGNYTITMDVADALSMPLKTSPPVRIWYGFAGTASTPKTMANVAGNRYTTTLLADKGSQLTYDFTASDGVGNVGTSSDFTYLTMNSGSCNNTKNIVFGGFALLAVAGIVIVAAMLIHIGEITPGVMMATTIALITLALIVLIGYTVVSQIALVTCV